MKFFKIFFTLSLVACLSTANFATAASNELNSNIENKDMTPPAGNEVFAPVQAPKGPCKLRIKTTLSDGTVIDGTIQLSDVGWLECLGYQVVGFIYQLF